MKTMMIKLISYDWGGISYRGFDLEGVIHQLL